MEEVYRTVSGFTQRTGKERAFIGFIFFPVGFKGNPSLLDIFHYLFPGDLSKWRLTRENDVFGRRSINLPSGWWRNPRVSHTTVHETMVETITLVGIYVGESNNSMVS